MKKWMYQVACWQPDEDAVGGYGWDEPDLEGQSLMGGLDRLGAEGWEMCASHVTSGEKPTYHYIFKLPSTDARPVY